MVKTTQKDLDGLFTDENKVPSELWMPKTIGERVSGVVLERGESQFGLFVILGDTNGNRHQTPAHKALIAKLDKAMVGDLVGVEYLGSTPSQYGQDTQLYDVFIKAKE